MKSKPTYKQQTDTQAKPPMHTSSGTQATHHARLWKGLVPLWGRQIPYTMMKFSCFERTVELLYKHVVPKPRSECTKSEQLLVTFVAGYIGWWGWGGG